MQAGTPFIQPTIAVAGLMRQVTGALLPGIGVSLWFLGAGLLHNLVLAIAVGLVCEALGLWLRGQAIVTGLGDGSALITALILALALPPGSPWWLVAGAMASALLLFKHAFGGLGQNPFNPAMAACLIVLMAWPGYTAQWAGTAADGTAAATTLADYSQSLLNPPPDNWPQWRSLLLTDAAGRLWINLAFMLGGLYLLVRRVINWSIPLSMLTGLALPALALTGSAEQFGTATLHLFSGGTMLAAFFIATDPASSPVSLRGRLLYGLLLGTMLYLLRVFGSFDDAVAIAVIFANFCAPLLDLIGRPRIYGHDRARVLPAMEDIAHD